MNTGPATPGTTESDLKGVGDMLTSHRQEKHAALFFHGSPPKKKGVGVPWPPSPINTVVAKIQKFQHFRASGALPHKTPGAMARDRAGSKNHHRASEISHNVFLSHNTPLCDKNINRSLDERGPWMRSIMRFLCRIMWSARPWSTMMATGGTGSRVPGRWKSAGVQSSTTPRTHHFSKKGDSAPTAQGATGGGERREIQTDFFELIDGPTVRGVVHRLDVSRWRAELSEGWWIGDGSTPGAAIKRVIIAYNREAVRSGNAEIQEVKK